MQQEWCLIESDPGVFNELIQKIGCEDIKVDEVYSLENGLDNGYGLIFLFKYTSHPPPVACLSPNQYPNELFFAQQMVQNACATQALLAILLNLSHVQIGQQLSTFKQFTAQMDSQTKGLCIANSQFLREVHNSFQKASPIVLDKSKRAAKDGDEVYHFISYLPFENKVYELDGLQTGPVCLGTVGQEGWLEVARQQINRRIQTYGGQEVHFNLLAVVKDSIRQWRLDVVIAIQQVEAIRQQVEAIGGEQAQSLLQQIQLYLQQFYQDKYQQSSNQQQQQQIQQQLSLEELNQKFNEIQSQTQLLQSKIQDQEIQTQKQKNENARRRHNYIPLIIELLQQSAKKGLLSEQMEILKKEK